MIILVQLIFKNLLVIEGINFEVQNQNNPLEIVRKWIHVGAKVCHLKLIGD